MHLRLIFCQAVNKNKLKVWKLENHRLSSFFAIKKRKQDWKWRGIKLVLFLSLFLSVHINFQYKLNSYKSFFIVTLNLISSIALLIFSHLQFHGFFLWYFFVNLMNMNKSLLSLAVQSFLFNFNSRKSKQTFSLIFNTKSTLKIHKLKLLLGAILKWSHRGRGRGVLKCSDKKGYSGEGGTCK